MELKFEIIETPRMILKGISNEVMKQIFDHFSKEEVKEILGHQSDEAYEKELIKHQNGYASYKSAFILFLMMEKSTQQIIGRCGLHNWNKEHNRAEIGYHIEYEKFKQKGYMTEAVDVVLNYGFKTLQLNRIEALTSTNNLASLKIIQKFNFKQEGILKQHYLVNCMYEDSIIFGLLKEGI